MTVFPPVGPVFADAASSELLKRALTVRPAPS